MMIMDDDDIMTTRHIDRFHFGGGGSEQDAESIDGSEHEIVDLGMG